MLLVVRGGCLGIASLAPSLPMVSLNGQEESVLGATGQTGSASCWRLFGVAVLGTEQCRDT